MKARRGRTLALAFAAAWAGLGGCATKGDGAVRPPRPLDAGVAIRADEVGVVLLPLSPPLDVPAAELSDLAWAGDDLLLLPQFPSRFGPGGHVFKLRRDAIERWLDGPHTAPLEAQPVEFEADGVAERIEGFEGFEALAVDGERVFLTVESHGGGRMHAHLLRGEIDAGRSRIVIQVDTAVELDGPGGVGNLAYEALTVYRGSLVALFESNGRAAARDPVALFCDETRLSFERRPMGPLEFRVTGATAADTSGRFWVTNIFWPGEPALRADDDPLFATYGRGPTHARSLTVERLVELQAGPRGVERTTTPPLQLRLSADGHTRNWEGVARLGERGFLLVADEHPATLFAFLPHTAPPGGR